MSLILLTQHNVAALKRALIARYPQIGSGHADEALAAGIGFRTHAALLAALKTYGSTAELIVTVAEVRVNRRLVELGYPSRSVREYVMAFSGAKLPHPLAKQLFGSLSGSSSDVANQN